MAGRVKLGLPARFDDVGAGGFDDNGGARDAIAGAQVGAREDGCVVSAAGREEAHSGARSGQLVGC